MKHRLSWIGWVPLAAVGVILIAVYVSWFAAYYQLGRRPLPSMDDPKFIGGTSTAIYEIVAWVILVSLVLWALGMITNVVIAVLPRTEKRRPWLLGIAGGIVGLSVLVAMMRYSPGNACSWILD